MKIPEKFHNSLTEKPFEYCKMCQKELLNSQSDYIIEKAYRKFKDNQGEELIFEIAICHDCSANMRASLSKESLSNIQNFFFRKSMQRRAEIEKSDSFIEDQLSECLLSGISIEHTEEYQIYAHCNGSQITADGGYFMLSDEIIEEIQSLLSKESKDELQRFADDNFGIPPELKKLFSRGDLVAI